MNENNNNCPQGANAMAIASFVMGLASLLHFTNVTGIVLGILGIIFAIKAKNRGNSTGLRKAGFVLSIIALICSTIFIIVVATIIGNVLMFINNIGTILQYLNIQ